VLRNFRALFTTLMMLSSLAPAEEINQISQVGKHYRIFIYEKNENSQNTMTLYTKLDSNCELKTSKGRPTFDFYWLMDRKKYKPVHPLIKKGVYGRLQVGTLLTPKTFEVELSDLKEVDTDLKTAQVLVESQKDGDVCSVVASMTLGESDQNAAIHLDTIYVEVKKGLNPFSRKLIAVTLKGTDAKTGQKIERRYKGQN